MGVSRKLKELIVPLRVTFNSFKLVKEALQFFSFNCAQLSNKTLIT